MRCVLVRRVLLRSTNLSRHIGWSQSIPTWQGPFTRNAIFEQEEARNISKKLGHDVFPSGKHLGFTKDSAANHRTWILVFLYTVSFGGGFTALTAWFPTYWALFHDVSLLTAGLIAAIFTVYGSLILRRRDPTRPRRDRRRSPLPPNREPPLPSQPPPSYQRRVDP